MRTVQSLIAQGPSRTSVYHGLMLVYLACKSRHNEDIKLLIREGASIEGRNVMGRVPIYEDAEQGHHRIVENLLDLRVKGEGLFKTSMSRGRTQTAGWITDVKASSEELDMQGLQALHYAALFALADFV
ncbi:uncharacterized protein B0J16DRAFT_322276 [Fusarium flagelliforme]|uniref:uncharacterized protein n=1 Tax=Fusarium flagelliforme TaxID=2675880 RepID=UPI001E8EA1DD|nr:uncharacterized protein B0J16DRAFT_322276 [Fusarium flagelliforme]KAH7183537.1 hypothetical protein B0J16DRAFT_322276 [Fusarium flagelliforme]